ncbi:hypothetical protein GCM10009624_18460 [Gordonia sinesedis]
MTDDAIGHHTPPPATDVPDPEATGTGTTRRPPTLRLAVYLMCLGAGLQLVGMFAGIFALRAAPAADSTTSARFADVADEARQISATVIVVVSIVAIALWLWMAYTNWQGYRWAHTTALVLGAIGVIAGGYSAFTSDYLFASTLNAAAFALALLILALLIQPATKAFYRPRRA